jgi:hypothetical protein
MHQQPHCFCSAVSGVTDDAFKITIESTSVGEINIVPDRAVNRFTVV